MQGSLGAEVTKCIVVECTPAVKAFLVHKDRQLDLYDKFILKHIDSTRVAIDHEAVDRVEKYVRDFYNNIVYEHTGAKKKRSSAVSRKRKR
eukprot:g2385.t1